MNSMIDVEYNTQRDHLLISEYGRIIQKMVNVALEEPNRDRRTTLAHAMISLMTNLNPQVREVADYKQKLWDHLYIISDFKLDVDAPFPMPSKESVFSRPELMDYPQSKIRFRFYGKNIVKMIEAATQMEEGAMKTTFINLIGSFMKNACKSWNAETLSDEEILAHLEMLSDGKIKMMDNENVEFRSGNFNTNPNQNTSNNNNRNRNFKNRNFKNRNGSNNNNGGGNRNNRNNFRKNRG